MSRNRIRFSRWSIALLMFVAGCASQAPPPTNLNRDEFATLYDDHHAFTDVYYMGSDGDYDYFCFEHWTFKPDGSDATLDLQKFVQVSRLELDVKAPFAFTKDEDQWRLLRPKPPPRGDESQPIMNPSGK